MNAATYSFDDAMPAEPESSDESESENEDEGDKQGSSMMIIRPGPTDSRILLYAHLPNDLCHDLPDYKFDACPAATPLAYT